MGFLDFLSGGLTAGTNAAAAYQGAKAQANRQNQQDQLTLYGLVRQQQLDAEQKELHDSQITENEARAKSYGQTKGTWKVGPDGNLIWVATTSTDGSAPTPVTTDTKAYVKPETPITVDSSDPTSRTKGLMTLGPGGVAKPLTDASGKPLTRTTIPTARGGGGAGSSAESIELQRALSTVNKQLADADKGIAASNKAITAGSGDMADMTAKQRAQLAKGALKRYTATRDSLVKVRDDLARRQQNQYVAAPGEAMPMLPPLRGPGAPPTPSNTPTQAPAAPTPSAASPTPAAPFSAWPELNPSKSVSPFNNNEGMMSDADLWEFKRAQGMSAEQATAYVRGRKR